MKPKILVALTVLSIAACSPAPPAPTPPPPTTTSEASSDAAIRDVFARYVEAVHAKNADAAISLTSSSAVQMFESYRQHALRGTESQLTDLLPPGPRSFVYVLRGLADPALLRSGSGHSIMSFAIQHGLISVDTSSKYVYADGTTVVNKTKPQLENLIIEGDSAIAELSSDDPNAPKPRTPLRFGFQREGRQWTVNPITVLSSASLGIEELAAQKGITEDQVITEALTARFGAARAAELRKPLD